jgi:hypothetical protein
VERSPGTTGVMPAPLATVPAVEDLAADRATGLGPGAAVAANRDFPKGKYAKAKRLAVPHCDWGVRKNLWRRPGSPGLILAPLATAPASGAHGRAHTGIGPGAAAGHVEGSS